METLKVAFSGPSGLGKSTLCKFVQEKLGIPWRSTSAGDILDDETKKRLNALYGYKGTGHKDVINLSSSNPQFGLDFQEAVLQARGRQISQSAPYVIDRSPIDNVVYLLSQVAHNIPEDVVQRFILKAQEDYVKLTHVVILVYSKDIPHIEDNGSRIPNRFYQQYISDIFTGVYGHYFDHLVGPRVIFIDYWDLGGRQRAVNNFLSSPNQPQLF